MQSIRNKIKLFKQSLDLVWTSSPGWATANITVSVIRSILPLVLLWFLKILVDYITKAATAEAGTDFKDVLLMIIIVAIIYFFDEALADLGSYIRKRQSVSLEAYTLNLLHKKSAELDLINFERPEYYDCLSRATREAPWRPNSVINNLIAFLKGSLSLILISGLIFTLHWIVVVILLVVNVPGIWLRMHYAGILYDFRRQETQETRKASYFSWLLTGDRPARELRLFGLSDYFIKLFRSSFLEQKEKEADIIKKRTRIELVTSLFKAAALLAVLIFIARRTLSGTITVGQMAMYLIAFRQGMIYISDLFSSLSGLYEDSLFIEDTFEFLNLREDIKAHEPVVSPSSLEKCLEVRGLSFTYPGNSTMTINNVSFTINKGEIIAIAGPNGAGKSTLVKLLCRLYDPDSGAIKWDGSNIVNMDPSAYRRLFSVVFQDFMLYNLQAGENIRLGNTAIMKDIGKIREAASTAGINDILSSLPEGYDTVLGNLFGDSRELSWGEWQKIALARALYRDSPVLVLDEPSSAMDADTEYEIFSRLREIVSGRTTILISHRLTNISLADRIIVLERGSVTESGTHEELMKKEGTYFRMYRRQTERYS